MNVLLDHCVPKQFGFLLDGHRVRTTHFMGWDELANGALLAAAAESFDALITVDRGMMFQQTPKTLPIAVIALTAPSNDLTDLAPLAPDVLRLLAGPLEKRVYRVGPNP